MAGIIQQDVLERESVADRLLPAAAALFRQKGYAGASIRDLAADLGIRTASLYHYIDTKEDLLQAICVASVERLLQRALDALAGETDPLLRLRALITAFMKAVLDEDRDMHAAAWIEGRWLSADKRIAVVAQLRRWEALLDDVIGAAQQAGALRRDISTRHLSRALRNLMCWSIVSFGPGSELNAEELGNLFGKLFLEGALTQHVGVCQFEFEGEKNGSVVGRR